MYDLKYKLVKQTPYIANHGSKINHQISELSLSKNFDDHFPKFKWKKNYGEHALLIRTEHDLESDIKTDNIIIRLTVTARHGFSNLTRIKSQDFKKASQIKKNNEFKFGRHLDTM